MTAPISEAAITANLRKGLLINDQIAAFSFSPSIGIGAAKMEKLGLDIRSFKEPLKRVVQQVMAPSFLKNFDVGGRPDAWEPLSDATLAFRERDGTGDKILVRSGLLRKTMGQLNIWTITTTTATIQDLPEKIWYGKVMQGGQVGSGGGASSRSMKHLLKESDNDPKEAMARLDENLIDAMRTGKTLSAGKPDIPERPFALIQGDDYDAIEKIFHDWFMERAKGAGFVVS